MRLFCFSYAGRGASQYTSWLDALTPEIDSYALQLPGREWRLNEECHSSFFEAVSSLANLLRPDVGIPYALFGHSLGGLLAFEVARELALLGLREPRMVIVSGTRSPREVRDLEPIANADDAAVLRRLTELGGTAPEVLGNPELRAIATKVFRADMRLLESYVYLPTRPRLRCPLVAFGATDDAHAPYENLSRWAKETTGPFAMHRFYGDHYFVDSAKALVIETVRNVLRPTGSRACGSVEE